MEQKQGDISNEVQSIIGSQVIQILSLNKRVKELEAMLKSTEAEKKV